MDFLCYGHIIHRIIKEISVATDKLLDRILQNSISGIIVLIYTWWLKDKQILYQSRKRNVATQKFIVSCGNAVYKVPIACAYVRNFTI